MNVLGVIPARLQSTRLPRKMLIADTGKPLIQHVWEGASRCAALTRLVVATDSEEIADAVHGFGGEAVMTGEQPSGTDRAAEVLRQGASADVVLNIQGDEPEVHPEAIGLLIELLEKHPEAEMSTVASPLRDPALLHDPACVKIARAADGRALYFSRSLIPHSRDVDPVAIVSGSPQETGFSASPYFAHMGLYGYRPDFLLAVTQMPPSTLEQFEKLEQLRALEAGAVIQVGITEHRSVGIDTPDDYARFVERYRRSRASA